MRLLQARNSCSEAGIGVQKDRLADEKNRYERQAVPMEFDQTDGSTIIRDVPANQVQENLNAGARHIQQAEREKRTAERLEGKSRQEEIDSALGSEANILSAKPKNQGGGLMVDDPAVVADISNFNSKSDKPYIYVYDPNDPAVIFGGGVPTPTKFLL